MVTRDIKATQEAIWRAVLEFGSTAHLARAIGVSREQLADWLNGRAEMPLEKYERMLQIVAAHLRRGNK